MEIVKITVSMSNLVLGFVAGTMLVISTGNPVYFIVNAVTAIASGILIAEVLEGDSA